MYSIAAVQTRMDAIVRGAYPTPAVTGRTVTPDRFKAALLHGELVDPQFPGAHFHRGFDLVCTSSGSAPSEPRTNARSGFMRRALGFQLRIGYLFGRDAPRTAAAAGTTLSGAMVLAQDDHEEIAQAMRDPLNWGSVDPNVYAIYRPGSGSDVQLQVLDPLSRALVVAQWVVEISHAPNVSRT